MADPPEDAYPICPDCLRPRELDEGPSGLMWLCDCGITPVEEPA